MSEDTKKNKVPFGEETTSGGMRKSRSTSEYSAQGKKASGGDINQTSKTEQIKPTKMVLRLPDGEQFSLALTFAPATNNSEAALLVMPPPFNDPMLVEGLAALTHVVANQSDTIEKTRANYRMPAAMIDDVIKHPPASKATDDKFEKTEYSGSGLDTPIDESSFEMTSVGKYSAASEKSQDGETPFQLSPIEKMAPIHDHAPAADHNYDEEVDTAKNRMPIMRTSSVQRGGAAAKPPEMQSHAVTPSAKTTELPSSQPSEASRSETRRTVKRGGAATSNLPPREPVDSTKKETVPALPRAEGSHVKRGGAATANKPPSIAHEPEKSEEKNAHAYQEAGGYAAHRPASSSSRARPAEVKPAAPNDNFDLSDFVPTSRRQMPPSPPSVPAPPPTARAIEPPILKPAVGTISIEEDNTANKAPTPQYSPVVGIDFGTSYSAIGFVGAGVQVIPLEGGQLQMPSVVSFPEPGKILIGREARERMAREAQYTIVSPKRLLGRLYKDPKISNLLGGLAFRTFAGSDKFVRFEAHGQIYSVSDICSFILKKLREDASNFIKQDIRRAVFSVPVAFDSLQRSALELAARQAGFEVVGLLTEPSAGVLSHNFPDDVNTVGVFDFGGGTFDFCILHIKDNEYQVLSAGGDNWLGGDDLDLAVANHLASNFYRETGVELKNRAVEWQALLFACEAAKRELSTKNSAELNLEDLLFTAQGKKGLHYRLTRKDFQVLIAPLVEKAIDLVKKVLDSAVLSVNELDQVIMTGGTSLVPAVRAAVTDFFGRKVAYTDPELAVVRGAAMRASVLAAKAATGVASGQTLKEVAGRTIGVGLKGETPFILFERDSPVPSMVEHSFRTIADGQTEMIISIYESSKSRIDESRMLGQLRYRGLRPAPAGQRAIDFSFMLDEKGMLHVCAIVEGKKHEQAIKL